MSEIFCAVSEDQLLVFHLFCGVLVVVFFCPYVSNTSFGGLFLVLRGGTSTSSSSYTISMTYPCSAVRLGCASGPTRLVVVFFWTSSGNNTSFRCFIWRSTRFFLDATAFSALILYCASVYRRNWFISYSLTVGFLHTETVKSVALSASMSLQRWLPVRSKFPKVVNEWMAYVTMEALDKPPDF